MDRILILDNYDSFTFNLYHLIQSVYKGEVEVKRDYEIDFDCISTYKALVISPGPGRPETTPAAMKLLELLHNKIPILGICLGLQCINYFFGGKTFKSNYPVHGKTSILTHNQVGIFKDVPSSINIARYHSLTIEPAKNIFVTSRTTDGIIMSIEHEYLPIYGLQFHPESFLSEQGEKMISNFLELTGIATNE